MPRYVYKCEKCETEFEEIHAMTETFIKETECSTGGGCVLSRIPQLTLIKNKFVKEEKRKIGALTDEYIEAAREDLKEQKRDFLEREE